MSCSCILLHFVVTYYGSGDEGGGVYGRGCCGGGHGG